MCSKFKVAAIKDGRHADDDLDAMFTYDYGRFYKAVK